jgi:hypothetical protein
MGTAGRAYHEERPEAVRLPGVVGFEAEAKAEGEEPPSAA